MRNFLCKLLLFLNFSASSALQPSDCTEFKVIPPEQYDRDASAAQDITKRPLGYLFASAKYPGVQSGGNLENPCAFLRNLTGRYVEVMVSDFTIKTKQTNLYLYTKSYHICTWSSYELCQFTVA